MTDALTILRPAARLAARCALAALPLWFAACSSTDIEGLPENLPEIALSGSSATPAHHLATYEYPFDSSGNYVSDWAAEGEHRAGRSARATSADERKWTGSHGGRVTGVSSSKKKSSSKTSKSKSGTSTKSGTKAKSGTKPKSGASVKYVVKKGDTVERIAGRYGTTVSKLKAANGLKSDLIRIGQTLTIPK